jgi:hypothetical protein
MNFHDPFEVFASAFGFNDNGLNDESNTIFTDNNFHPSGGFGATTATAASMFGNAMPHFASFFGQGPPWGMMHPPPPMHHRPPFWHPPPPPPHAMFGPPFFAGQPAGQTSASFFSSTSSMHNGVVATSTTTRTQVVNGQSITERVERRADGSVSVQRRTRSTTANRGRQSHSNVAAAVAAPPFMRRLTTTERHDAVLRTTPPPEPQPPVVIDLLVDSPPQPPPPQPPPPPGASATTNFGTDELAPTLPLTETSIRPLAPILPRWSNGVTNKEAEHVSGSEEQSRNAGKYKRAYNLPSTVVTLSHHDSMHSSQRTGTSSTELPGVDSSSSLSSISSLSSLSRSKRQRVAA